MAAEYFSWQGANLVFNVFLQPRASKNSLLGLHDKALKISLTAPPVDGEANKQLIKFLSKLLGVKKSAIKIVSGEHSRYKRVSVCAPSQTPAGFFK